MLEKKQKKLKNVLTSIYLTWYINERCVKKENATKKYVKFLKKVEKVVDFTVNI